jgi:fructokinase
MERIAVGLDMGGTKLEAVVAREGHDGLEVLTRRRVPTPQAEGYDAILGATAALFRGVCAEAGLDPAQVPFGVGLPGGTTRRGGLVKNANTTCLNGRPFRQDLQRQLGRAVVFDNDANLFALAETLHGAARAARSGVVFGVILGTGVGGGVVLGGKVWQGLQGIAGEWGHHAVFHGREERCYCGRSGCLELYASGPAVEADYAARSGRRLPLAELALRRAEDPHAKAAIDGLLEAFARGLANVIDVLDPSVIVLGGGVSNLPLLLDEGRDRVAGYVFNDELETPILRHALGDSAGVLGAALLALAPGPFEAGVSPTDAALFGPRR